MVCNVRPYELSSSETMENLGTSYDLGDSLGIKQVKNRQQNAELKLLLSKLLQQFRNKMAWSLTKPQEKDFPLKQHTHLRFRVKFAT